MMDSAVGPITDNHITFMKSNVPGGFLGSARI